jgi:hypothetical protein
VRAFVRKGEAELVEVMAGHLVVCGSIATTSEA